MKWFELYRSEFGKDINQEFDAYEQEFRRAFGGNLEAEEVLQAIRDLKEKHTLTRCFDIRLPGPADIIGQIKRNRKMGDKGEKFLAWIKARASELHGDVELFNAIVDPVNTIGALRDTTPEEIVVLLAWARDELSFDEQYARDTIAAAIKEDMTALKRECDETAKEWAT